MNKSQPYDSFSLCEDADPALPGDPWSHLRYHYGQLLGAEDLTAEQRAFVLRHRLHLALLHGCGTVWGLKVDKQLEDPSRLYVGPGIAVDFMGREIFVNEKQCLDVAGLGTSEFWSTLKEELGDQRRAYVVLCYEACFSQRVPSITPPCSDADDAFSFGRINDRFRIELVAEAPQDPHDLHREWLSPEGSAKRQDEWITLRDRLLDHQMNCFIDAPDLTRFWNRLEKAPLLLAAVDFLHEQGAEGERTIVDKIDNRVRALLPATQLVAEQVFGHRLVGRDSHEPLKLVSLNDNVADVDGTHQPVITLTLSEEVAKSTLNHDVIKIYRLESGGWSAPVDFALPDTAGPVIELTVSKPWSVGTVYQLHLLGSGRKPIVTVDGCPLAGWWDEPTPIDGRGRDVSIVRTWNPEAVTP